MAKDGENNQKKPTWGWKTFLIFYSVVYIQVAIDFFSAETEIYQFFHILMAFDKSLKVIYWINLAAVIINLLHLVPLFFFVYRVKFLSPKFWQAALVLRFVFDLTGHYYEFVFLKSVFLTSPFSAAKIVLGFLLVTVPSYWACYHYAFRWDKIFPKQIELFN